MLDDIGCDFCFMKRHSQALLIVLPVALLCEDEDKSAEYIGEKANSQKIFFKLRQEKRRQKEAEDDVVVAVPKDIKLQINSSNLSSSRLASNGDPSLEREKILCSILRSIRKRCRGLRWGKKGKRLCGRSMKMSDYLFLNL